MSIEPDLLVSHMLHTVSLVLVILEMMGEVPDRLSSFRIGAWAKGNEAALVGLADAVFGAETCECILWAL